MKDFLFGKLQIPTLIAKHAISKVGAYGVDIVRVSEKENYAMVGDYEGNANLISLSEEKTIRKTELLNCSEAKITSIAMIDSTNFYYCCYEGLFSLFKNNKNLQLTK